MDSLSAKKKLALSSIHYNELYRSGSVPLRDIPQEVRAFVRGLPTQPYLNGRTMFVASRMQGKTKVTEAMGDISAEWTALPTYEKEQYEKQAQSDLQSYREAISHYLESNSPVVGKTAQMS